MPHAPVSVAMSTITAGLYRAGVGEGIGKDEPAFSVGVHDLDGLAGHGAEHVAGFVRAAAWHVLRGRQQAHDVERQPERRSGPDRSEHRRAAGHVVLHPVHVLGGLDRDAAGIEGDRLADEGDEGFLPALPVLDDDELRRLRAARGNAEQAAHAELSHPALFKHPELEPELPAISFAFAAMIAGVMSAGGELTRSRAMTVDAAIVSPVFTPFCMALSPRWIPSEA